MKAHLLSLLACPHCGGAFTWRPVGETPEHSWESDGLLECPNHHRFPVIQGIPRFLDGPLFSALQRRYPNYFAKTDPSLWRHSEASGRGSEHHTILLKTIERFGYEWTKYSDYNAENFARFLEPMRSQLVQGMVALDAGCGAGRHLAALADAGIEVVGADLSWAVETASSRARNHSRVHIVQTDLCCLPFRRSVFDFAYSLGVLHHLPDPSRGVGSIAKHIRPGGFLLAWVYMWTTRKVILEPLRRLFRRVPPRGIDAASLLLAAVEYGLLIGPYALLCRACGRSILRGFVPRRIQEYAELGFRVSRIDWYDRLAAPVSRPMTMGQAQNLLARPELCDQVVTPIDDSWWQIYARVCKSENLVSMT